MEIVSVHEPIVWKRLACEACHWQVDLAPPLDRRVVPLDEARQFASDAHAVDSPTCHAAVGAARVVLVIVDEVVGAEGVEPSDAGF